MAYNHDMKNGWRKLLHVGELLCAIGSAVLGTIAAADPNAQPLALLWWTITIVSILRLLTFRRDATPRERQEVNIVARAVVASVVVFCLVMLVAFTLSARPQAAAPGRADLITLIVLATVGISALVIAVRMIWR